MKKEEENRAIYLPAELYDRVKERAEATGFGSIDEYIAFVAQEILKDEEPEDIALDQEQEKEVKKRLRALGYLD